jgi:hypothetical protein
MLIVPENVLLEESYDEAMILNTKSEKYFGLNSVGVDMWRAINLDGTLETAINDLLSKYNVTEDELKIDLLELIEKLKKTGLLEEK